MKTVRQIVRILDWGSALFCLAWGIKTGSYFWLGGGLIALAIAAINPVPRIEAYIAQRLLGRRSSPQ